MNGSPECSIAVTCRPAVIIGDLSYPPEAEGEMVLSFVRPLNSVR